MYKFLLHSSRIHCKLCIISSKYSTKISPKPIVIPHDKQKIKENSAQSNNVTHNRVAAVNNIVSQQILDNRTAIVSDAVASVTKAKAVNKQPEDQWQQTPLTDKSLWMNQYLMLSKIRLTTLVVMTSMVGYGMAPAPFELSAFLFCTVGTGLCSAAANSINQYHEVPFDAQMSRTKNRALVRGLLTPMHAVCFAAASALVGTGMLYFGVNGYCALLGFGNLILYTSIYTPMKRISIANTWVGSIVGAIPPLMGWVGCTGVLDAGGLVLAGLLYCWQFPHFNALSWNLRQDYSRAGYRMMAVSHPGLCRRTALRYTIALQALCVIAPLLDVTNNLFAIESLPVNAYFTYLAWNFYQNSDSNSSRKLFRYSLLQLPLLLTLFVINRKGSKDENDLKLSEDLNTNTIS